MPPSRWWSLVQDDPDRHGWMILQEGSEVGYLDAELDGGCVYVALLVFQDARGRGVAGQAMRCALSDPVSALPARSSRAWSWTTTPPGVLRELLAWSRSAWTRTGR